MNLKLNDAVILITGNLLNSDMFISHLTEETWKYRIKADLAE